MNQLLEKLDQLNVKLSVKGDQLDIQAPKGVITPPILEEIKIYKTEIISFLKGILPENKIPKAEEKEYYVTSSTQKRLWLLHQMNPENVAYHIPMAFEMEGSIDIVRLQKTFEYLIKKHEALRTVFKEDPQGNPVQVIRGFNEGLFTLTYSDSSTDTDHKVQEFIDLPFNLKEHILFRGNIFKISENKHLLLLVIHHIICDGWSIEVLARDFFEIYNKAGNNYFEPEKLPIQYKDYAVWQQEKLKSEDADKAKKYWLNTFAGEIPVLELPSSQIRPKYRNNKGNTVSIQIERQDLSGFQKLCSDNNATVFMGLKTLVDILLSRYCHQNDIIIGTPIANREYPELQNQIGFYSNTLALRVKVDENQSFIDVLRDNRSHLLEAYRYQEYPFDELVLNLNLVYDPSRNPLFDVMISLQEKSNVESSRLDNVTIKKVIPKDKTSKVDLMFNFFIDHEQLNLYLTYDSEIYDEVFATALIGHLKNLIREIIINSSSLIKTIDFLNKEERHQLLYEFNDTKTDFETHTTIIQLFEEQVERAPEHIALLFEDQKLTYKELNEQANKLGGYLRQHYTIQPDDLIAIKLGRSEKMIVAILGILKSGGAYVPIDPEYPQDRIDYIVRDTHSKVMIDEEFFKKFHDVKDEYSADNLSVISKPEHLMYVIYTSGTTGYPKGVMIENKNVVNYIKSQIRFLEFENEVTALVTTYTFDASVEQIFLTLLSASTLLVVSEHALSNHTKLKELLTQYSVTHLHSVPSLLTTIDLYGINSLKRIISAGEKYDKSLTTRYGNAYKLYNKYGPTESTISVLIKEIKSENEDSLGYPFPNTSIYILDHHLQMVPIGVKGKLFIAGAGISRGYLNQSSLTEERFIENPFVPGTKMYNSGDMAKWMKDGSISFLGREDHQIKIRGYRIETKEIEILIHQYSTNIEKVVVDIKEVNKEQILTAYYTVKNQTVIDKTDIIKYLRSLLPGYMVPGLFISLENIPLTSNGKTDYKALFESKIENLSTKEYCAPRNEVERQVVEIWQEVLGVEKVSIFDNFFELGGHSLLAMSIINRINEIFECSIKFNTIFETNTPADLAELIISVKFMKPGSQSDLLFEEVEI
ncbi:MULTISPECIES: non-ribosomal peptide synthetase [Chryseobacterium]|uniref:non-ribosomal peptide synthetase n=1 Tax=Chryseobacterium TaxID=59732 RepID=UPI001629A864|nr:MULTISPECIES: non-ribosomal peptide synthetase [Chryseobacterium]MDM1553019.1 amino acid adenylation domain-containing protein [Chryseobacterium indologenes]